LELHKTANLRCKKIVMNYGFVAQGRKMHLCICTVEANTGLVCMAMQVP